MAKHNYSQYSSKNNTQQNNNQRRNNPPKQVESEKAHVKPASVEPIKMVEESVETVALPATVEGMVVNCARLNVRENASVDSGIVCVLDAMSEIEVDVNKSTSAWVYVYTAMGHEGYCMRQYIEARL